MILGVPKTNRAVCFRPETGELLAAGDPTAWETYKRVYRELGGDIHYAGCDELTDEEWNEMVSSSEKRLAYGEELRRAIRERRAA